MTPLELAKGIVAGGPESFERGRAMSSDPVVNAACVLAKAMLAGNQPGTVYAIIVNEEYVKIGFTKFQDARGRIADIQKGCPYPFRVALEHKGGFPFEQAIHHLFQSYRLRDEWFRYEGQLKEFIDGVEVITRSERTLYPRAIQVA